MDFAPEVFAGAAAAVVGLRLWFTLYRLHFGWHKHAFGTYDLRGWHCEVCGKVTHHPKGWRSWL